MSIYGSRQLARYGHMGSAFGGGDVPVFGPYAMSDCAISNFYDVANYQWLKAHGTDGGANYFTSISYTPPNQSLKDSAYQGYLYLKDQVDKGNAIAEAKFNSLDAQLKQYLGQATTLAAGKDDRLGCGDKQARNWGAQQALWETFVAIVKLMKQFSSARSSVPAVVDPPMDPVAASSSSALTSKNPAYPSNDTTSGGMGTGSGSGSNTMLYVGLGVGALALIGGVFFLRRRRAAVSGYRRRRRHR